MTYISNPEITFLKRTLGGATVIYRLLRSSSERGGFFILLTSVRGDTVEDAFIPYVSERAADAEKVFRFLAENEVTPCTVFEILDDYFSIL